MMRMLRRAICLASMLLVAACGADSTAPQSIAGSWAGATGGVNFTMTVSLSGATVSGNGQVNGSNGSAAATIDGTFSAPNVSLTINASGLQPTNFTGTLSSSTQMSGVLNGSGYTNQAITFTRQ